MARSSEYRCQLDQTSHRRGHLLEYPMVQCASRLDNISRLSRAIARSVLFVQTASWMPANPFWGRHDSFPLLLSAVTVRASLSSSVYSGFRPKRKEHGADSANRSPIYVVFCVDAAWSCHWECLLFVVAIGGCPTIRSTRRVLAGARLVILASPVRGHCRVRPGARSPVDLSNVEMI